MKGSKMAQKVIDGNMHFLPEDLFTNDKVMQGFLDCAPFTFGVKATREKTPDGKRDQLVLRYGGHEILNYVDGDYSLEAKLNAMDEAGVDVGMLRMPVWQEWLPIDMCKIVNDGAADMCKRSNGRLVANAVITPWGRKEDIYELERCLDIGFVGVQFAACYGNLFLDDEKFRPYLTVLNEKKVPAVIHHTPGVNCFENYDEFTVLRRELGRLQVQATAVGREIYSGMFNDFPNLVFIHTMLGGNWFGNHQILAPHVAKKTEAMNRLQTNVTREDYDRFMQNNIYFDACHALSWGTNAMECAVKTHGADHILLGSSFPVFYEWLAKSVDAINALDITQDEKDLILGGNAQRIFKL
jgi:predicted TIM-barrel fold metal-dependent hydrolase